MRYLSYHPNKNGRFSIDKVKTQSYNKRNHENYI